MAQISLEPTQRSSSKQPEPGTDFITRSSNQETSTVHISSISALERMRKTMNLSASDIAQSTENSLRHSRSLTIENFIGIWLDLSMNQSNNDSFNYISRLRSIINFFKTFIDLDQCIDYLAKVKNEKVFLIVVGSIGQNFVSVTCDITQLTAIYIFRSDKSEHEPWASQYKKVRGVFTQFEALSNELKDDVCLLENALTPFSVIPPFSPTGLNELETSLNELDSSFMYSQLLKEILLEKKYNEQQKKELVDFCHPHYVGNQSELTLIDEFDGRYPHPSTIWWYTREGFLYNMLNKALRTQEIEVIMKMGFVIRHLHQEIEQLYSQQNYSQSFILYRGQGMAQSEFDKINNSKGGLLAFNSFLSTSRDEKVALGFARKALKHNDLIPIVFKIKMDLAQSVAPFASLDDISDFKREKEILFSMHTVFRIEEIKQIEPKQFEISLTLTKDNDQQLTKLTEYIRKATRGQTRLRRLGSLMIAMAEFDKAKEIYSTLRDRTSEHDREGHAFFYHQLGLISWERRDLVSALSQFQQALNIYLTYLSSNDPQLSPIYSNIGTVFQEQGDFDNSLKHLTLALNIDLHALQSNQVSIDPHAPQILQINIATRHNNIGLVVENQSKYDEALKSYKRALKIELAHLPPLHPLLAATYNNIGMIEQKIGNNSSALSYYQKTLEIFNRSLPSNHPSLAIVHYNLACVDLYRTQEVIEHTTKAVNIARHTLGLDHPQVKQYQQYLDELQRKL